MAAIKLSVLSRGVSPPQCVQSCTNCIVDDSKFRYGTAPASHDRGNIAYTYTSTNLKRATIFPCCAGSIIVSKASI